MNFDRKPIPPSPALARGLLIGLLACTVLLALPEPVHAATTGDIFGTTSPIRRFINFITGSFAYLMVIVGVVITLGGLVFGNDMSGFARRAPLVVVAGGVLILSRTVVGNLFGTSVGAEIPADLLLPALLDILPGADT